MRHEDLSPPGSRLLSLSLRPRVSFTQRLARTSDSSVRVPRRVGQTRPVVDVSDAQSEDAPSPSNGRQSYGHRVRSPTFERRKGGRRPGRAEARHAPQNTSVGPGKPLAQPSCKRPPNHARSEDGDPPSRRACERAPAPTHVDAHARVVRPTGRRSRPSPDGPKRIRRTRRSPPAGRSPGRAAWPSPCVSLRTVSRTL